MADFLQDHEPYPTAAGDLWFQPTTGNAMGRNQSNSAWTFLWNFNLRSGGLFDMTDNIGSAKTFSGAILGKHGLAPKDSAEFTALTINGGLTPATREDLTNSIATAVKNLTGTGGASTSVSNVKMTQKLAITTGTKDVNSGTNTIEINDFPVWQNADGTTTTSTKAQCQIIVAPTRWAMDTNPSDSNRQWDIIEDTAPTDKWRYAFSYKRIPGGVYTDTVELTGARGYARLRYMIIALRN